MSGKRKLTGSQLEKLRLYQQFMSFYHTTYLAYISLFMALEGIVMALAVFMRGVATSGEVKIIGIIGFGFGLILLWLGYRQNEETDKWKDKISKMCQSTDIEEDLKSWTDGWHRLYTRRRWMRLLWLLGFALLSMLWYFLAFRGEPLP